MEYAEIKAAVEKLNATGTVKIKTVAVKAEDVKTAFLTACSAMTPEAFLALDDAILGAFLALVGERFTNGVTLETEVLFLAVAEAMGAEGFLALDPAIIKAFVHLVGNKPDDVYSALSETIRGIYDTVPDSYFTPAPAAAEAAATETSAPAAAEAAATETPVPAAEAAELTPEEGGLTPDQEGYVSSCSDFKKNCDPKSATCKKCAEEMKAEFAACKKGTKGTKKAAKAAAKSEKKAGPKIAKNAYGHRIGSMSDYIDGLISRDGGATNTEIVEGLMATFSKDAAKAAEKLTAHIQWITNKEGRKVEKTVEGEGDAKRTRYVMLAETATASA